MANLDHYLPCEDYAGKPTSESYPGFTAWYNDADQQWYFSVVTNSGRTVLRSEGYSSESGRNNGIESVIRNRDIEERYDVIEDEGLWFVILRAGNRQEIARSCGYGSESEARANIAACRSDYVEKAARAAVSPDEMDNYLPCEAYEGAPASESYPGFRAWYNEENAHYYFAVATPGGRVVLRSEGYTTESARNNGIESVIRNRDIEERYSLLEEGGEWFVILKAGNHQEIARSCAYGSEADAMAGIAACRSDYVEKAVRASVSPDEKDNYLPCEAYADAPASERYPGFRAWFNEEDKHYYFAVVTPGGRVALRSEGYTTEAARNNGIESVIRNRDIEERYTVIEDGGEWFVILKAGNHQEIARSCSFEDQASASEGMFMGKSTFNDVVEEKAARSASAVIEDYLHCEAYSGKSATSYEGFTGFQDADSGLYYFAMVDSDGKVVLKSEGYTAESSRNNGIESVIRNRDIKERWVQSKDEGGYYMSLRAGNHQEIARTCHYDSEGALLGWWMPFSTSWSFGRQAELVEVESEPASLESIQVESIAAATPVKVEIEEVAIPEPEIIIPPVEEKKVEIEVPIVAAAVAAAAALPEIEIPKEEIVIKKEAEIIPPVVVETEKEYQPKWKKKEKEVEKTVVYTKPVEEAAYVPPVTQYTEREPEGGGGWWKWLLPLLLLGLLFWLWKGCDGCKKQEVKAPEVSVTTPAAPAPVETAPPPPPPAPTCNCTGNADDLFNIGSGTPKSLTRLGTNPEFGNSHGLTGAQFYEKLAKRAKTSRTDAAFLDRVFKGMGYTGWADATPEMFSEVEVPAGSVGNMGYSKAHKTVFARLDTEGKDRLAFRIKAKNACDMHFMKTCGNHFFFCPK